MTSEMSCTVIKLKQIHDRHFNLKVYIKSQFNLRSSRLSNFNVSNLSSYDE